MKAWLGLGLSVLGLAFCACATDSTSGEDSGSDASLPDANQDANKDASKNDASDATVDTGDAASDAPMDDASDDSGNDADIDASDDGSVSDGGPFDAGKGCLGVFCIKGDKCCNVVTSKNYGKCEAISCLACCM